MAANALPDLERRVPGCRRCRRLVAYRSDIRREHPDYWCRPVPSFGDPQARLVIVGLAPGLHGANRSGRPFWLDASGEWLYGALERVGRWDGERLADTYIVNAVKCVPPGNKPSRDEMDRCRPWLAAELEALVRARVVLALGQVALQSVLKVWQIRPLTRAPFSHGALHRFDDRPALLVSYHPSRQNTNTGVLTRAMWRRVFDRAERLIGPP